MIIQYPERSDNGFLENVICELNFRRHVEYKQMKVMRWGTRILRAIGQYKNHVERLCGAAWHVLEFKVIWKD